MIIGFESAFTTGIALDSHNCIKMWLSDVVNLTFLAPHLIPTNLGKYLLCLHPSVKPILY